MNKQETFFFKAATGFGAVIDGSVVSVSAAQVKVDLIKQGLFPVRIWADHSKSHPSFVNQVKRAFRSILSDSRQPV